MRSERLVGENGIHGSLCIPSENIHLILRISLGHDDHINSLTRRASTVEVGVGRNGVLIHTADKNVGRVDTVGEQCQLLHLGVGKAERDVGLTLGHRHLERELEGLPYGGCLGLCYPLLEEARKTCAIDNLARSHIGHC